MNILVVDSFGNYNLLDDAKIIPRVGDVVFLNDYPRNVTNIIWFSEPSTLKKYFFEIYKILALDHEDSISNFIDYYEVIVYCGN